MFGFKFLCINAHNNRGINFVFCGRGKYYFLAPASRCLAQSAREVNIPVDSITISTPSDFHGNLEGSLSMSNLTSLPFITSAFSFVSILPSNLPCTESYFYNNANDFTSARSLIATTSMPPRLAITRKTFPSDPSKPTYTNPYSHSCSFILNNTKSETIQHLSPRYDKMTNKRQSILADRHNLSSILMVLSSFLSTVIKNINNIL